MKAPGKHSDSNRFPQGIRCTAALRVLWAVLPAVWLGACATPGGAPPLPSGPTSCEALNGMSIPAAAIALPTHGAKVTAAQAMPASGSGPLATGSYCKVSASIAAVDPAAPDIRMEIDLPDQWNGKALMMGGGGFDGSIPNVKGNVPAGPVDQPVPLARGYATFGSDSGHRADPVLGSRSGAFGTNDEAVRNFSYEALKKTRDTAIRVIAARYGQGLPRRAYFAGGSSGGREALAVAQRWPQDWDGVIVLYPAWNAATLDLQFGRITRALAEPGAYPDASQRKALFDASLQACDALDGVADGLISHWSACHQRFDPATAMLGSQPLRCPSGSPAGEHCLTDTQIAALKVYDSAIEFDRPQASGETQYPGFNLWGTDLGMPGKHPTQPIVSLLALNTAQPASPMPVGAPYLSIFWDQWIRYFVTRDPQANSLAIDPRNPGQWQPRIDALTRLQDVNATDLSAFMKRGGKILMAHGIADPLVSTRATEQYFQRLQVTMGAASVDRFVRFYEIPGYGHAVGTVFNAAWDSLTTMENWVERDVTPPPQIVADSVGVPGRTRPLCRWPEWPRYNGSGDVNRASSFTCTK